MSVLLSVEHLSKSFGGLKAVADVSLTVTSGEICSVIGPNGAGKTTLFNMISGVLRPTGGRILFDGIDLATVSPSRFAGIGIGRTFQNLALFKHGTVVENILTGRHTHLRSNVLDAVIFFGRTRREERSRPVSGSSTSLNSSKSSTSATPSSARCLTVSRSASNWRGRSPASRNCCCSMKWCRA
jgi:ABC-type branched-subunit amino acid transport system ATPase component